MVNGLESYGWLSVTPGLRRVLFVWNIRIDESHRGRGVGKQAMLLAEAEARTRGLTHIGLNVMGGNETARQLYRSLGYTEMFVSMEKPVTRETD